MSGRPSERERERVRETLPGAYKKQRCEYFVDYASVKGAHTQRCKTEKRWRASSTAIENKPEVQQTNKQTNTQLKQRDKSYNVTISQHYSLGMFVS
jgi:hypothetical protein